MYELVFASLNLLRCQRLNTISVPWPPVGCRPSAVVPNPNPNTRRLPPLRAVYEGRLGWMEELLSRHGGPYFMGDAFSLVDIMFISFMERHAAGECWGARVHFIQVYVVYGAAHGGSGEVESRFQRCSAMVPCYYIAMLVASQPTLMNTRTSIFRPYPTST